MYFGHYEKVVTASGSIERTDLSASVRHLDDGTSNWFEYVHRDHLGSVDVITSSAGTLIDSLSHDPFGGRRDADWSADISTTDMATILANEDDRYHRGFTDHEQLNRTGFIHMNGRVYDPRIGRFVSPDPIVQAPAFSQNYNRYSYVFNNPLSATDPSGFTTEDLEWDGDCYGGQGNCSPRNANTDPFANGRVDEVSKQLQRSLWKRRFSRMVGEFYGSLDRYERFAPPIHWFAKQASGAPVDRDVAHESDTDFSIAIARDFEIQLPARIARQFNGLDYDQKISFAPIVIQLYPFDVGFVLANSVGSNAVPNMPAFSVEVDVGLRGIEGFFGDGYTLDVEAGVKGFGVTFDEQGYPIGVSYKAGPGANIGIF